MKALILPVLFLTSQAFAADLLKCSPPMGSHLQEVRITAEDGKIFLTELNFAGSLSQKMEVPTQQWVNKDLRWTSPQGEGSIRLYKSGDAWFYTSTQNGSKIIGYCLD